MKRLAPLLLTLTLFAVPLSMSGWQVAEAQSAKKEKPSKPKTVRSEVLGKNAFNRIEEAQVLLGEEKYAESLEVLQSMLDSDRFKPYEKAVAIQTMGYV